jgi:hypothetical protein
VLRRQRVRRRRVLREQRVRGASGDVSGRRWNVLERELRHVRWFDADLLPWRFVHGDRSDLRRGHHVRGVRRRGATVLRQHVHRGRDHLQQRQLHGVWWTGTTLLRRKSVWRGHGLQRRQRPV